MTRRLLAALLLSLAPLTLFAQIEVPSLRWRSIETEHFRLHYEPGLEDWARDVASRIESVRAAVVQRVDYANPRKIDIIIEDPLNVPNGNAWPSLMQPSMRFWATPPAPSSVLGGARGWGEILSVHEYAHLAHLTRPSREPFAWVVALLGGLPFGPLTFSPSWVTEGYATVIEGELTGEGRPNGVARPAILRQLALEGYLPAYGELGSTGRFNGGAMRYLVGSAYLDWLQQQRGDSALPQLWRRVTARESRDFEPAFLQTFGAPAAELYGRFSAELTRKAHEARARLEAAGLAQGALIQHWNWSVGAPAISPDGKHVALRRASPKDGARVLVLETAPSPMSEKDSSAVAKRLEKDPLDLPDYRPYPRALKRTATLSPSAGAAYDAPRWFADNRRLLVTRSVPRPDGRVRPDLFVWDSESGKISRVTKAAGIMLADPFPDGRRAAAISCGGGSCSLLLVDLEQKSSRVLAAGGVDRSFHGVRVSPDGRRIASARQRGAHWDVVVVDAASGEVQVVGPRDGATRHSATWAGDTALIVVSEAEGLPTLERITLDARPATVVVRTIAAASAPDVGPDGRIWWLDMHGRGYDLRANDASSRVAAMAPLDTALYPAVRRSSKRLARDFAVATLPDAKPYGLGPQSLSVIGGNTYGADGTAWSLGISTGDILSRGTLFAVAGRGDQGTWGGTRAALTWRGLRPALQLQGWNAAQRISRQGRLDTAALASLNLQSSGWLVAAEQERYGARGVSRLRLGYSATTVRHLPSAAEADRSMAFTQLSTAAAFTPSAALRVEASMATQLSQGSLDDEDWRRAVGEVSLSVSHLSGFGLGGRVRAGYADAATAPLEQFVIGGSPTLFVDAAVLDQRVVHPGLPVGVAGGRRFAILTAETPGPLRLYHDWISAGTDGYGVPIRVLGGEVKLDTPRLGVFRLPAGAVRLGLSHVLNGQVRNMTSAYASLILTP